MMHYYYPDEGDYYDYMRQQQIDEYRRQEIMRQRAAAIEHERRLKAIEAERRRRILIAQEQQRLIEEQAEQERKEREYAQKLYEYQRRTNARRPRETIVQGRDGRLYRYIVNDADTDNDDDESLDRYQESATVRDRSVQNAPVVSIPVHRVTSDASRPSAAAMSKEVHVASSSSMDEDDDSVAMEEATSVHRNHVIVEYASDDEDDIHSKANASLVPNADLGESWMEPVD
eukprot:CAMPEP_0196804584 /NCGR_PEP_ID=MMETSP1362-20130617/4216_1 /TAXON_ID=163516 /ORGANISM="Leptocylindrus danicus, Strain CCMP1856" /LENGTH=229 /DNA_ID=CAMNT_0042176985 /DNA_START=45 /DNA_END=734 /DNA_ORIENTATION=-